MQPKVWHSSSLDTKLRFAHPLQCDEAQLYNALDCYSGRPQGHWPVKPRLVAPLEHYRACYKVLEAHPEYETVAEYLLAVVKATDPVAASLLEVMLKPED